MSGCGTKADGAVVLRTTFYFVSGFITEDAQQREVLDCYCRDFWEFGAVFEGVVFEVAYETWEEGDWFNRQG